MVFNSEAINKQKSGINAKKDRWNATLAFLHFMVKPILATHYCFFLASSPSSTGTTKSNAFIVRHF